MSQTSLLSQTSHPSTRSTLPLMTSTSTTLMRPRSLMIMTLYHHPNASQIQSTTTPSPRKPLRRNPTRSRKPPDRLNLSAICSDKSDNLSAYHITARRAMKEIPDLAEPAILLKKKVFTGRHFRFLSKAQQTSIIRSAMNVTQKVAPTSDGSGRTKDKVKVRLVGGGDGQDRNHYTRADTSSPTVSISLIFIIAQLAAAEQRTVVTLDIGSAYLNAAMPKDDPSKLVFMRIQPDIATLIYKLDPQFANSAPTMDHSSLNLIKHYMDASRAPYSGTRNSPHSFAPKDSFPTTLTHASTIAL